MPSDHPVHRPYDSPAGGLGSLHSVTHALLDESAVLRAGTVLPRQNKPGGFACVSCAWAKPADPHPAEFCENGAKATAWELTAERATSAFFSGHRVSDLRTWSDHDLEKAGRLTEPLRYDAATDRYRPVNWSEAFEEIGRVLRPIDPRAAVFYTSGRASLETAYMWQLLARLYGTNNLPDSSNMCHESTSVALPEAIGSPVGTVSLDDFAETDCILFFGQNVGTSSPRMLHPLQAASERGVPIITFNPLKERGLERFINPQSPGQMLTQKATEISSQYHQLKPGGDIAAMLGLAKALLDLDAAGEPVLDQAFLAGHTHGFEAFAEAARAADWPAIEAVSGLSRAAIEAAARVYGSAKSAILVYGMGLTQHREGVLNVRMAVNLLLMRGNIGRPGAGICPVRGHSNVQGQRTVGIAEKPDLVPLDRLGAQYGFEPPRWTGMTTVDVCDGVIEGRVRAFLGLGGNFLRAAPDTARLEATFGRIDLTVHVATKLNRTHLHPGAVAFLLPCLGRIEVDRQRSGRQAVTVEDSTGHIHASRGLAEPAAESLLSEPAIVAGIAKATLGAGRVPWDAFVANYGRVREAIAETFPEIFHDFNARMDTPGGFPRPIAAKDRVWNTPTGKANFATPPLPCAEPMAPSPSEETLRLMTLRSNGQFNTTVYSLDDRFRGIRGTRMVLLVGPQVLARHGLADGDRVTLATVAEDGIERRVCGLTVVPFDLPDGSVAGYYPECNPLIPVAHHAKGSKVPAAKSVPVRLARDG